MFLQSTFYIRNAPTTCEHLKKRCEDRINSTYQVVEHFVYVLQSKVFFVLRSTMYFIFIVSAVE